MHPIRHWPRSGFNPRPRAGGDDDYIGRLDLVSDVSIHAPARGATHRRHGLARLAMCFNPRPRAGGDRMRHASARLRTGCFNPRPRAGGDVHIELAGTANSCFNPRPRAGGDRVSAHRSCSRCTVSIHAPARGATASVGTMPLMFQSTPPRGGRRMYGCLLVYMFQSTPPRGGRPCTRLSDLIVPSGFNPRPRAGGDLAAI